MSPQWKILKPKVKKVSLPVFLAYWAGWVLVVLGIGFTWGF